MRQCGECRFCCWSFNVTDVPSEIEGLKLKPCLESCPYECSGGCSIFGESSRPKECVEFECPYLKGDDIHRPDTFQEVLMELGGNMGNYVPTINISIPKEEAIRKIKETRTVPAGYLLGGKWVETILPLDKNGDTWEPQPPWNE